MTLITATRSGVPGNTQVQIVSDGQVTKYHRYRVGKEVVRTDRCTKRDDELKIYSVGRNLLAGGGWREDILEMLSKIDQDESLSARDTAHQVYEYFLENQQSMQTVPGILIAGPTDEDTSLFLVQQERMRNCPTYDDVGDLQLKEGRLFCIGSGLGHGYTHALGAYDLGVPFDLDDPAEALLCCYELNMKGQRDMGVNGRRQYGFVDDYFASILMSPEIGGMENASRDYLNCVSRTLLQKEVPETGGPIGDSKSRSLLTILGMQYTSLEQDLLDFMTARREFIRAAIFYQGNQVSDEAMEEAKHQRQEAQLRVTAAIDAFRSGKLENIIDHLETSMQKRRERAKQSLLALRE